MPFSGDNALGLLLDDPGDIWIPVPQWEWDPQPDITACELALALPVLLGWDTMGGAVLIRTLPENVRRHFKES